MLALQDVWVNFGVGLTIEEYDANNATTTNNRQPDTIPTITPSTTRREPSSLIDLEINVFGGATTIGFSICSWKTFDTSTPSEPRR